MAHMSRKEYRRKREISRLNQTKSKSQFARSKREDQRDFIQKNKQPKTVSVDIPNESRSDYRHVQLNFWTIFSDRPYVSVFLIVLALFMIMTKFWWGLVVLLILIGVGIYIIGHSHHPNRVLSIEFKLKASRKLSMLRAIQLGASVIMFLATYMKRVVSVNFSSAGSSDGLNMVESVLSTHGGSYGQQGTYFINLLNTLTGGQLWSSYRYATNSSQMMNSAAGRAIIMWILLLMIAPAFCVLAQLFREPYSRNATLIGAIISAVSLFMTPSLMRRWVAEYGIQNNLNPQMAANAISIEPMAYVAMICSVVLLIIALYRFIKKDNFV